MATTSEILKQRDALQQAILKQVVDFEQMSGLLITSISINRISELGAPPRPCGINVTAQLPDGEY